MKKAQKSAPKDTICCVCSSTTETGHMVECECCSSLPSSYPFICPFCVKQTILELNKLCVTLSNVQAGHLTLRSSTRTSLQLWNQSSEDESLSSDLPKASTDNIPTLPCPATIYKYLLVCHHGQKWFPLTTLTTNQINVWWAVTYYMLIENLMFDCSAFPNNSMANHISLDSIRTTKVSPLLLVRLTVLQTVFGIVVSWASTPAKVLSLDLCWWHSTQQLLFITSPSTARVYL